MKSPASGTWMRSQMCKRVSCYPRALILRRRWLSEHVSCFSALLSSPLVITTMRSRTRSAATCMVFWRISLRHPAWMSGCNSVCSGLTGWKHSNSGILLCHHFHFMKGSFSPKFNLTSLSTSANVATQTVETVFFIVFCFVLESTLTSTVLLRYH